MPAQEMVGGIFRFLFQLIWEALLYGFFYLTGAVLIPVFSLGNFVADSRRSTKRRSSSRREVDPDLVCAIGVLFWGLCIGAWLILR